MYVISQILPSLPITDEITDLILTYILNIHITCNMFFDKCAPKIYIPAKHTSFIADAELTPPPSHTNVIYFNAKFKVKLYKIYDSAGFGKNCFDLFSLKLMISGPQLNFQTCNARSYDMLPKCRDVFNYLRNKNILYNMSSRDSFQ